MVEESFPIITETVVGRTREDYKKFGLKATGYIGKHIVGTGEETHLTTKVLIDLLKPHVILCCGKRGSGKCVTGDTLIYTTEGIVPIEKLVGEKNRKSVISLNQENYEMSNSTAVEFFEREVDKVINIKLRNGLEVNTTENHPLLTIFGWKEAKDLNVGDFVAIPSKISVEETENSLSNSQIKLLAYFLSEGTVRKTFAWFTNSSKELVNDFYDAVANFDSNLNVVKYGKFTYRAVGTKPIIEEKSLKFSPTGSFARGNRIIVRRNTLLNWLKSLGVDKKSDDKFIPNIVFSLPSEKIALFLKCLFSGDGSFYEKKGKRKKGVFVIEYSSKSRTLIEGVYHLLLRFGINSYIRQKKVGDKNYYRLLINDKENVRKFLAAVGNFSRDEKLLQKFLEDERKYHSNYDLLPKEIWNYIRRKYKKKDIGKALGYKNWKGVSTKYKYNPLRATVRKIAEFFNDEYLLKISSPDIMWVKILEKREINKPTKVYDISVTKHHNFIGNGIILHNSYSAAVILEEFCQLEEEFKQKLAFVVVDPMGIYWSMKFPNEQQAALLKEWSLEPKGFKDFVRVYVPAKQKEDYERAGIPVDGTILISLREFSAEDLILAFGLKRTEEIAIALEKNFNKLLAYGQVFGFEELIEEIKKDSETRVEIKNVLISLLRVVAQWGLIAKEGIKLEDLVQAGKVTVIDLSRMPSFELRSLLAALLTRKIYHTRVLARKEEERVKIEGGKPEIVFPITWLVIEESHNFIPSDREVASSDAIKRLAKEGREPGIGLLVITQMPNKVHQDILSQCDLVISFRLTSKDDLQALHAVYQSYMAEDIEKFINKLPRWAGAAIILDDMLEKVFTVNIRPRLSWHAGGTAALV
ncbi:MAG: LAGLIDADG family homing endonuclease [Candidatus Aenigmatarchaeota archaeon]